MLMMMTTRMLTLLVVVLVSLGVMVVWRRRCWRWSMVEVVVVGGCVGRGLLELVAVKVKIDNAYVS
jgi:membrane protein YdbS with pleckstrin-like domain